VIYYLTEEHTLESSEKKFIMEVFGCKNDKLSEKQDDT
jgi:hypothetical protein